MYMMCVEMYIYGQGNSQHMYGKLNEYGQGDSLHVCRIVQVTLDSWKSMGPRKNFEVSRVRVFKSSEFSGLTNGF